MKRHRRALTQLDANRSFEDVQEPFALTHNIHHAHPIGDRFVVLRHGRVAGTFSNEETTRDDLLELMAGGLPVQHT